MTSDQYKAIGNQLESIFQLIENLTGLPKYSKSFYSKLNDYEIRRQILKELVEFKTTNSYRHRCDFENNPKASQKFTGLLDAIIATLEE